MKALVAFLSLFPAIANAQANGFAKSADATPLYYRTFGQGAPLLIINGGPGMNSNGFEALATKLGRNNLAIIYDQRGTGKSEIKNPDTSTVSMDLMAADIETLRRHLNIRSWIVLGHSFGGMLGSYYTSLHPDRVEKLILSSSGGIDLGLNHYIAGSIRSRLSNAERDSLAYWNARIAAGDPSHAARLGRGRALAPAYVVNRDFIPVLAERLTQGNPVLNSLIWSDLGKIGFDCSQKLRSFPKPVLIIQGEQDIIKPETARKAHRVLQNSKVVLLDNCGHYGWLDAEHRYFEEINRFLKA